MIESIRIKNFRGIQGGGVDRFKKVNLLVGPNNSGKSAVLEAIYLAGTASRSSRLTGKDFVSIDGRVSDSDLLGDDPVRRILDRHQYASQEFGGAQQQALAVHIASPSAPLSQFQLHFSPRTYESSTAAEDLIALFSFNIAENMESRGRPEEYRGYLVDLAGKMLQECDTIENDCELVYCWANNLTYYQTGTAAWAVGGQRTLAEHTLFYDASTTLRHLPMDFFRRMILKVPGWSQRIARHFDRIFGIGKAFNVQFLPTDQEQKWVQGWIAPSDQIALTIDSFGDGARTAFKLLTPLIALAELSRDDAPGLFVWEEPELFHNPETLNSLLTEVAKLLKDKPIQLFVATHSMEVVANFVRLIRESQIDESEMQAVRLNLVNGKLLSSLFSSRDIQDWTEMHLDLRVPSGKVDGPLTYQIPETTHAADLD